MKRRILSILMAACLTLGLVPALGQTAKADNTGGTGESGVSADTYASLGLAQSAKTSEIAGNPLGGGDIVCANPLSELYVNFNAEDAYGWSVQDKLVMQSQTSNSGVAKGALEFYGADEAKGINAYTSNKAGALYDTTSADPGKKTCLGSDLATSGHNPIQYSTSVAVSPDTGKKNYVAELTVDSGNKVKLTMCSVTGGKAPTASVDVCTDANLGSNTTGGRIYEWEYDALFDLAAGDMNGDGYDEIAVYANNKVTVYSTKGGLSVYGEHDVVAPTGISGHYADAVVALAMGDIDQDDCDELVIANSESYGCTNLSESKVEVLETSTGAADGLAAKSGYSLADGSGYVRGANVAIGDVNNDSANELVVAGYYGANSTASYDKSNLHYAVVSSGGSLSWSTTAYQLGGLKNMTDNTKQAIPPVSLACAATQGMGFGDQVFLAGCLYSYDGSALTLLTQIEQDTGHKKDDGGGSTMNEIWIGNVTVGNFNGSDFGQEQILYTYAMKHEDSDRYWYDIGYINKAKPGSEEKSYYYGQEQAINCDTCYNYDGGVTRCGLYLSLAAVDTDDDSTLMRFDSKSVSYTNPEVYAVLQAAPYFGDLDEAENYVKSGSTSYGTSKSSGSSVDTSGSFSVGAYADFEQDFSILGVKLATLKAEVSTNHTFTHSFERELTKTTSISYTGSAKNDYAVVYTVPYIDYTYNMWIPAQTVPSGSEYDTWIHNYVLSYYTAPDTKHSGSGLTAAEISAAETLLKGDIKAGDKVDGQWQKYTISIPLTPVTAILAVDAYDAVAGKTAGLEPIRGNLLNSTPGEPATYTKTPGSGFTGYGNKQVASSSAEGASATVSQTEESSTSNSFHYNFECDAKLGAGVGGVTAGVSAGFGVGVGGGSSTSKGVIYTGTVDNLPKDASNYFMYWTFGTSTAKLNNNNVIILCYKTEQVKQPPAVPSGLCVTNVTSDSVTLQWNKANGAAYYDLCYVNANGRSLVKRLKANAADRIVTYTDTGLTPDSLHHYCVMSRTSDGEKSGYSATVEAYTLDANSGNFGITSQPQTITVYAGGTAKFTVAAQHLDTAGNALTDVKYQWQYYDPASCTWKDCGGNNTDASFFVSGITSADSGRLYRCYVYVSDTLYLYSDTAALQVGLADSTTALTAAKGGTSLKDGDTLQSSYTTTAQESYSPKQYQQNPDTKEVSGVTYTHYTCKPDGSTSVDVWKDDAGDYYTESGGTMSKLTTAVKQVLNFNEGGVGKSMDVTGITGTAETGWTTTVDGVAFTSTTKYTTGTGYTAYRAKDADGTVKWFVVRDSDSSVYAAEWSEFTTLTISGNTVNLAAANLQPVTVNGSEIMKTTATVHEGDAVTLTAAVTKKQSADLNGEVTFTVYNSDGSYYNQFTASGSTGTAVQEWKPDTAGVYTVYAAYGSDTHYAVSTSNAMTLYVLTPGKTSLALSGSNLTYGNSLTMAATELTETAAKAVTPTISGVTYNNESVASPETLLSADGANLIFKPDKAGVYVITVTYQDGGTTLTASKTVAVYDKTLTVTPDDVTSANFTYQASGWVGSDSTTYADALKNALLLTSTGTGASDAGTYPVYAAYTSTLGTTDEIDSRYTVVCKTGSYQVGETQTHHVTAVSGGNGSVQLKYTRNGLTIDAGTEADIPAGTTVTAVAAPNNGYRLAAWKLDGVKSAETSNTLTVAESLDGAHTVSAEFVLSAYTLTFGPKAENTGAVSAVYWDNDTQAATTDPFSSGSKLTSFSGVQLTAVPAAGYYLKGWTTDGGTTLIAPSGSTYLVSKLTADKTVEAVFAPVENCTVTVTLKNGTGAVSNAEVSFNDGTPAAGTQTAGFYTYSYAGSTGSPLTVRITLPGGLIVTGWDGADGVGTLSASRKVLTIPAIPGNTDLTVNCSTPNSYAVTASVDPASQGTVVAYLNGSATPADDLSAVSEASSIRFVAKSAAGDGAAAWKLNGKPVPASAVKTASDGSQEYTLDYLSGNADVTVTFGRPTVTFAAPEHGTLLVSNAGTGIASGDQVDMGTMITVKAVPDSGYTLHTLTVNGTAVSSDSTYQVSGNTVIAASFDAQTVPSGGNTAVSGGGDSTPTYTLSFNTNGGSAIPAVSQLKGAVVELSGYVPVRDGYTFDGWYSDGNLTAAVSSVSLTANTTVYAKWTEKKAEIPFTDVPQDAYYKDAVLWAVAKGVAEGTSATTFDPSGICDRAQAVTFLWRAAGSPKPKSTAMPFKDIAADSYCYNAVLWAMEQGITKGTSDAAFDPAMHCSREQIVTLLWRAQGSAASAAENPFADVDSDAYYKDAVLWAAANAITNGTTANAFSPDMDCSRAQIVTFLYRCMGKQK